jgi:hypothetical protein
MTKSPTFLFCDLPPGDRMPLDQYMEPLLERLPKSERDILSELPTNELNSWRGRDDSPYPEEPQIQHSLLCKLGCKCTCRPKPAKVHRRPKRFQLCNKQLSEWKYDAECREYLSWGDILMAVESSIRVEDLLSPKLDGFVTLWVPLIGNLYEWTTHSMKVLERSESGVVQRYTTILRQGMGRISWEGEGSSRRARLLKIQAPHR